MSIFYDSDDGGFFDEGGIVEVPHSVLLSSLDAEIVAETYGVAVEDILMARQELFAQSQQQQQMPPQPAGYWADPGYSAPTGTVVPPRRPTRRPRRPPARPRRGVVIRPRGRIVVRDRRTTSKRQPRRPVPSPFQTRPTRR